ncbi:glucose dehydrogenase [Trichonephila clavipes]|nr:glucose dehydrogenase [Trichonephila clavipes]
MLYVRGNRQNYDNWAAQGAEGWSYEDVFPYFLKLEDNRNPEFLANGFHAFGGPLTVEKPGYESEIKTPIKETARQFGYKVLDANADEQTDIFKPHLINYLRNTQVAAVAEWYRYRTVACFVTGSSPVPLKTRRVGQRCTLNLSRAEMSSRWCGVVVRRGGASSGVVHVT